jgi:hypothetical protein
MYMAKRLAFTFLVTVLGTSALLTACADDGDRIGGAAAGGAGNDAGADTGGSSSGGSSAGSAGKGGSLTAGGTTHGGQSQGGAGASGAAAMAGEAGATTVGGASEGEGGATDGEGGATDGGGGATDGGGGTIDGGGGAGGADNPPVAYACGSTSLSRRLCSAYVAAECESLPACSGDPAPEPCCTNCPAPVCPDCVAQTDGERQTFSECPACLAEYDRSLLCAVEPFEAGNLSGGVACFDDFGPYQVATCDPILFSALDCVDYLVEHPCPATWPLE